MVSSAAAQADFAIAPAAAEYPPLALWAAGGEDSTMGARSFLMLPLNEVVDEHYSVYMCRTEGRGASPPAFCR